MKKIATTQKPKRNTNPGIFSANKPKKGKFAAKNVKKVPVKVKRSPSRKINTLRITII